MIIPGTAFIPNSRVSFYYQDWLWKVGQFWIQEISSSFFTFYWLPQKFGVFIYTEKATNFEKNIPISFDIYRLTSNIVGSSLLKFFVVCSENLNFIRKFFQMESVIIVHLVYIFKVFVCLHYSMVGGGRLYKVPQLREVFHKITGARDIMLFQGNL